MSDGKLQKFPVNSFERICNSRGKLSVSCIITDRWLQFGKIESPMNIGTPITLDIMTDVADDNQKSSKKICGLVITLEQLQKVLKEIADNTDQA